MTEPYSIFLPSDFSPASERAFAHALAIAVIRRARLTLLHAGMAEWSKGAPSVREMLTHWGFLDETAGREAVFDELAVRVHKIESRKRNPLRASLAYLERDPADLLVLSTAGRRGLPRWLHRSVAERLARKARVPTLFVPAATPGFIDSRHGKSSLRRVLVPMPRPGSLAAAAETRRLSTAAQLHIDLLHPTKAAPPLELPARQGVIWESLCRPGEELVSLILETARSRQADLIVMPAEERPGPWTGLRSSTMEKVLRASPCPVLAVR